jgi:propanol-preferring alcohol dehydrogenase
VKYLAVLPGCRSQHPRARDLRRSDSLQICPECQHQERAVHRCPGRWRRARALCRPVWSGAWRAVAVDSGGSKKALVESYGVEAFVDFAKTKDVVGDVLALTGIGADAVVVTSGNAEAYAQAADMLWPGGSLSCVGISSSKTLLQTSVAGVVIKGFHITGSLVGSLKEGMEAMEYVRKGIVKPQLEIRKLRELPQVYEQLEKGDVSGRIVLRIAD